MPSDRPLARAARAAPAARFSIARKILLVAAVVAVIGFVVSKLNLARDLHRLDATIATGPREGNYYALGADLSALAQKGGGRVTQIETAGTGDNVKRLGEAASGKCDVQFALAQDGTDWTLGGAKLQTIARLRKAESVFFLGKDADAFADLRSLAGKRIGVGPKDSGSARLAKQIFELPDLAALEVVLTNHSLTEQLEKLERGELDLGIFIMDEDAPFIVRAVRERNMQMAGLVQIDVVARRLPQFRTGRIGAGQYDAVKVLPAQDKKVLRVETLVIGNGCASRSTTLEMLGLLAQRYPDLVKFNKDVLDAPGLELSPASKGYFEHGGPELADEYVPWLVDVMPPTNWAYIVMAVSVIFNAMGAGHRFRLWRIDDARVKLEAELGDLFGKNATLAEIRRRGAQLAKSTPDLGPRVESLIARFEALAERSRRQSLSMLVPMGQEMAYRYQEGVIHETVAVLRDLVAK